MKDGRAIAESVDPETSNDICTFCRHVSGWITEGQLIPQPQCSLGHTPYFRSMSNYGPLWVSDCKAGELRPELAAAEKGAALG